MSVVFRYCFETERNRLIYVDSNKFLVLYTFENERHGSVLICITVSEN